MTERKPKGARKRKQVPARPRFRLTLERVELAAGWDGRLRGGPEPCLLVGLFQVAKAGANLLGRCLHRLGTIKTFPHTVVPREPLFDVGLMVGPELGSLAILCLVVEEDSGRDIEKLFSDVAAPDRLAAYAGDKVIPDPISIVDLMAHPASEPPHAEPLHLLRDGRPLDVQLIRDKWIAASMIRLDLPPGTTSSQWMLEACSQDQRNDWTLWLHARVDVKASGG